MDQDKNYWHDMKEKAAANIAAALDAKSAPSTEEEVKTHLAYAFRHCDWDGVAEVLAESCEWLVANLMCHHQPKHHTVLTGTDHPAVRVAPAMRKV